jgi:hypothetical protein
MTRYQDLVFLFSAVACSALLALWMVVQHVY